jgi:hypothetical protein
MVAQDRVHVEHYLRGCLESSVATRARMVTPANLVFGPLSAASRPSLPQPLSPSLPPA